jgi:hypothetical protein
METVEIVRSICIFEKIASATSQVKSDTLHIYNIFNWTG